MRATWFRTILPRCSMPVLSVPTRGEGRRSRGGFPRQFSKWGWRSTTHDATNASRQHHGQGARLWSWRVAILPYIVAVDLYKQFKLDEPWDSQQMEADRKMQLSLA